MSNESGREFLEHHGIKGMKWGVRRKKTVGGSGGGKTSFAKQPARLSEAELRARIGRMELEKKYSDLNASVKNPGKHYAKNLLSGQGKSLVGIAVGTTASFLINRALKAKFGEAAPKIPKALKDNIKNVSFG